MTVKQLAEEIGIKPGKEWYKLMEYCIGVSTETVLQIVKLYTVVKRISKLMFWTVVLHRCWFTPTKDYSPKMSVLKFFLLQCIQ